MLELRKDVLDDIEIYIKELDWAVFPCKNSADPDIAKSPFPVNGFKDAVKDFKNAKELFLKYSYNDPLIGIATGKISNLFVMDIDNKNGKQGDKNLLELENTYGKLPESPIAQTPSINTKPNLPQKNGFHRYFQYVEGLTIDNTGKIAPDIDYRCEGGYVIAPPSKLTGHPYLWLVRPKSILIPKLPQPIIDKILTCKKIDMSLGKSVIDPSGKIHLGSRDKAIFDIARNYKNLSWPYEKTIEHLIEYNNMMCEPPLSEKTVIAKVKSAYKYSRTQFIREIKINTELTEIKNKIIAIKYNLINHEPGMADLIYQCYKDNIAYTSNLGWLVWNGKYWERDDGNKLIYRKIFDVLEILEQIALENNKSVEVLKLLCKLNKYSFISSIINRLSTMRGVLLNNNVFNSPKTYRLFNCSNGTFNLKTGLLQPFNPLDHMTGMSGITYDPAAQAPEFERFLNTIYESNQDTIDYVLRFLGYCLTAETTEQKFLLMGGMGKNGKSQLLAVMQYILGDYYYYTNSSVFVVDDSERRLAMAQSVNSRLLFSGEFNDKRFDESFIKSITGGEKVSARLHHKEPFTYIPTFKLAMTSNNEPKVSGTDYGFYRRCDYLDHTYRITEKERKDYYGLELFNLESSGIFNVIHQKGYTSWAKNKLGTCKVVTDATERYKQANDILFDFFEEYIEIDKEDNKTNMIQARLLLQKINEWRPKNKPMSPRALNIYMKHKGFKHDKKRFNSDTNPSSMWWGLKLIGDQSTCHHTELIEQQELKIINGETVTAKPVTAKPGDDENVPF